MGPSRNLPFDKLFVEELESMKDRLEKYLANEHDVYARRFDFKSSTCLRRRSEKVWGERDGHFEVPRWTQVALRFENPSSGMVCMSDHSRRGPRLASIYLSFSVIFFRLFLLPSTMKVEKKWKYPANPAIQRNDPIRFLPWAISNRPISFCFSRADSPLTKKAVFERVGTQNTYIKSLPTWKLDYIYSVPI